MGKLLKTNLFASGVNAMSLIYSIIITTGFSTLVSQYDGLFSIFLHLRRSRLNKLFECEVCLSVYLAIVPAILLNLSLVEYLTVVGASVIILRHV